MGDGGALMAGNEIATAAQYGGAPIIVISDNRMYGTIGMHHHVRYPGRPFQESMKLTNPDFAAWGRSFGAEGITIRDESEVADGIARAFAVKNKAGGGALPYLGDSDECMAAVRSELISEQNPSPNPLPQGEGGDVQHSPSPCGRGLGEGLALPPSANHKNRATPGGKHSMDSLPLDTRLRIGIQTIHRRTEPASRPWRPAIDELVSLVELVDRSGYDLLWVGDHISFAVPILDPLLQLAQAAVVSRRLTLGTSVYLLPLRHPTPVAKQVATLDHLTEGRLIFGVGVGGEFPKEYEVCGVPITERGARLTEGVTVLRKFWSGETVSHDGRFYGGSPTCRCAHRRANPAARRSGSLAGRLARCVARGDWATAICPMS